MPGSPTAPGRSDARVDAPVRIAFRQRNGVGTRDEPTFAAQWLAYAIPCRRFAYTLAGIGARLGADVARYAFIVVDSHHLLLAGLPAHSAKGQSAKQQHPAILSGYEPRPETLVHIWPGPSVRDG